VKVFACEIEPQEIHGEKEHPGYSDYKRISPIKETCTFYEEKRKENEL
jgi:hypothetical protein